MLTERSLATGKVALRSLLPARAFPERGRRLCVQIGSTNDASNAVGGVVDSTTLKNAETCRSLRIGGGKLSERRFSKLREEATVAPGRKYFEL